jgi:hypothetical protein
MIIRLIAALLLCCLGMHAAAFDVEYVTTVACANRHGHCVSTSTAARIVQAVQVQAALQDVPEKLVWQVMHVESKFNPEARSKSGAVGLMQIIPYWHRDKIAGRSVRIIEVNVEVGVAILREYLTRYRTTQRALQAYVGNRNTLVYSRTVLAVKRVKYQYPHTSAVRMQMQEDPTYSRLDNRYRQDLAAESTS